MSKFFMVKTKQFYECLESFTVLPIKAWLQQNFLPNINWHHFKINLSNYYDYDFIPFFLKKILGLFNCVIGQGQYIFIAIKKKKKVDL